MTTTEPSKLTNDELYVAITQMWDLLRNTGSNEEIHSAMVRHLMALMEARAARAK